MNLKIKGGYLEMAEKKQNQPKRKIGPRKKDRRKDEYRAPDMAKLEDKHELEKIVRGIVARQVNDKEKEAKLELKNEELEQVLEQAKKGHKILKNKEEEEKQLKNMEGIIEERKALTKKEMLKINERLFFNLAAAAVILVYFIYINYLHHHTEIEVFLRIIRLFSCGFLGITILLFEVAYRNDSGHIAIISVEFLALSIASMMLLYLQAFFPDKLCSLSITIAISFAIYYTIKSLVIYIKGKRAYLVKNMKKEMEQE